MKKITLLLGIIGLFITMAACSDDSGSSQNQIRVSAKGTYVNSANKSAFPSNDIELTSFRVNVAAVTLKYYETDGDEGETGRNDDDHEYHQVTVNGPWELDLLNQASIITTIPVPNGTYKKAELELSKSLVTTSPIFDKTVQITGTIDGTPFVFWNDFDETIRLGYHDLNETLIINNNSLEMVFNFDLNQLMDMIDLSSAEDGDGDGVIEIGPNDTDGNNELAQLLHQHFGGCGGIEHHGHDD